LKGKRREAGRPVERVVEGVEVVVLLLNLRGVTGEATDFHSSEEKLGVRVLVDETVSLLDL
jgi:hypothetical protein